MDMRAEASKRDESKEEDDEAEKRDIINDLYRRRLVSRYADKKDTAEAEPPRRSRSRPVYG